MRSDGAVYASQLPRHVGHASDTFPPLSPLLCLLDGGKAMCRYGARGIQQYHLCLRTDRFVCSRCGIGTGDGLSHSIDVPAGSGKTYWWNTQTNEVTAVGAAKPLATAATAAGAGAPVVGGGNAVGGPLQQGAYDFLVDSV